MNINTETRSAQNSAILISILEHGVMRHDDYVQLDQNHHTHGITHDLVTCLDMLKSIISQCIQL